MPEHASAWFVNVYISREHGYKQEGLISPFVLAVNVGSHLGNHFSFFLHAGTLICCVM